MTIDPNKTYRTRDGQPVRIYATDGKGTHPVHGAIWDQELNGWVLAQWSECGIFRFAMEEPKYNLVEVTLADELTDQIPWEMLRPEIQWVAMDADGQWFGYSEEPTDAHPPCWTIYFRYGYKFSLTAIFMPDAELSRWRETKVKRPKPR